MENMEVWGTPDFKSNSPAVAAACMFYKIHSVGGKKITNYINHCLYSIFIF